MLDEFLLWRLLRFVSAAEVAVNRSSGLFRPICRSAVPDMRIKNHYSARRSFQYDFVGMGLKRIFHFFIRHFSAEMGSGDQARSSVGD